MAATRNAPAMIAPLAISFCCREPSLARAPGLAIVAILVAVAIAIPEMRMSGFELRDDNADHVRLRGLEPLQRAPRGAGLDRASFDNVDHALDCGRDQWRVGQADDRRGIDDHVVERFLQPSRSARPACAGQQVGGVGRMRPGCDDGQPIVRGRATIPSRSSLPARKLLTPGPIVLQAEKRCTDGALRSASISTTLRLARASERPAQAL